MSDFKDNVKVAIRIRPLNDQEFHENAGTCLSVSEKVESETRIKYK